MGLSCIFGHKWNGCKCERCGTTRNEQHRWNQNGRGCKCEVCGAKRNTDDLNAHSFPYVFDPNYLGGTKVQSCKCEVCGYVKQSTIGGHIYNYTCKPGSATHTGTCITCGRTMTSNHFFENGICKYCGYKPGIDLNKAVADFAAYVSLSMDQSELDAMENKLLEEGDSAEEVIFNFLARCSYGGVGNIDWFRQAKRLTRMIPKFRSVKTREHLQQLADNASRSNIWEYHTEIADVAKEELARLDNPAIKETPVSKEKEAAVPEAPADDQQQNYTFRMTIEDVFSIPKMGTVACGLIETGEIRKNDIVQLIPKAGKSLSAMITEIRKFEADHGLDSASAGETVGLVCQGLNRDQLSKGDVFVIPGKGSGT